MGSIHPQCLARRLDIGKFCRRKILDIHISRKHHTSRRDISTYRLILSRKFSTGTDNCDEISVTNPGKLHIYEAEGNQNLLHATSSCLRNLRLSKPYLFSLYVDKTKEWKMMDTLLAFGVTCFNASSVDVLLEKFESYINRRGSTGLYVHIDDNYDHYLSLKKEKFDKLKSVCSSIFLDVSVSYTSDFDLNKLSQIVTLLNPTVIRFSNGLTRFSMGLNSEFLSLEGVSDNRRSLIKASLALSKDYDCTIMDLSNEILIGNHDAMEVVFFPKHPDILSKIYGYDVCSGAILASLIAVSSENTICPIVVGSYGLDYIHTKSVEKSTGPGTTFWNIVDSIYNLNLAPDSILSHHVNVKFWRCEHIE